MRDLAAVSIDLDEVPCYCAIHGLAIPRDARAHAIYRRALPHLLALLDELDIRATLFVVARDLESEGVADALRDAVARGHEVASHSLSHRYDLTRMPLPAIELEVREATERIEESTRVRPVGFRAPGYTITDDVLRVLEDDGYLYDSSVFPCPSYFGAKALAIGLHALRGRKSRSIVDDPRVLAAPADPYRVGRPYHRRGTGLIELPIGVTSDVTLRAPFIGTSVVLGGATVAKALAIAASSRPLVNLELHGIDLADALEDDLAFLAPYQPDLKRSRTEKRAALRATFGALRERGKRFVTLAEAAREVD